VIGEISREETPEKYKIRLLKILRGSMPERKIYIIGENNFFFFLFLSFYFILNDIIGDMIYS
jgi:hypothetical protein